MQPVARASSTRATDPANATRSLTMGVDLPTAALHPLPAGKSKLTPIGPDLFARIPPPSRARMRPAEP